MSGGRRLLDVNVLLALLWPPHAHHKTAQAWFAGIGRDGWATCPVTQLGLIRIVSRPGVSQGRTTAARAAMLLAEIQQGAGHEFWPDNVEVRDPGFAGSLAHIQGPGRLTDRYLLALAAANGGTLATFDRSVGAALPADSPLLAHLEVIPA